MISITFLYALLLILFCFLFLIDMPILFEVFTLRRERNKFLDKIHKHKLEVCELKRELLELKKENEQLKVGETK